MRNRALISLRFLAACAALAAALLPGAVRSADFGGKTIEFVIPFPTAGGSDVWARFFAPFLQEALPGKPTVVVKNVPGGGSITGTNQFVQRAKPDGLSILGTSGSTQLPYLLDDPRVRYELKELIPVLVSPTGGVVYVNPTLGAQSARDIAKLRGKKMKYGSQGPTSLDLVPVLAFEIMGLDVDPVFGLARGPARVAFERGESLIDYQTSSAYLRNVVPLIKTGKAVPLFSWGVLNDKGEFVRDPTFPDLPHFAEAYETAYGKKPSGTAYEAFKAFVVAGYAAQKPIFLPKGTPKDIVDTYVQALDKVVKTPAFKEKAGDELGDYEQAVGPAAQEAVKVALSIDPQAKAWVRDWLTRRFNVKFDQK
ncbi:MAG TPA: tripartite tricarboxylate transporter substrate-binding protein [Burkholderiales bacterium]|nr:tripartite tricarboxylate transporter substrate-binding protein [Burkholderiales bacterium]